MKLRKTNEPKKRIDLDREVMADLEATDTETESVRGGKNYTRAASTAK